MRPVSHPNSYKTVSWGTLFFINITRTIPPKDATTVRR